MRKTFRYDKELGKVIPLDEWYARNGEPARADYYVVGDIEPYKAVTGDMEGKWITSRAAHKEFLRRNDLIEVGNEKAYFTRHGGKTPDNPTLMSEQKHEERICQSLTANLERLRR